jgi:hypothetical protein
MVSQDKIETAIERIVRLETKLDFLIAQFDRLPPSPVCITHHNEVNSRVKQLDDETGVKFETVNTRLNSLEAWRNRAIGAVMILIIVFNVVVDKIAALLGLK